MISPSLFCLFLAVSLANIVSPGLGTVMIVMLAAQNGWRRTFWGCWGLALGIAFLFILAVTGVGIIVAGRPVLFASIKAAGAFFLFYLAVKTWFKPTVIDTGGGARHLVPQETGLSLFAKCVVISITNPQPIVFGISVLPQFIDPAVPFVPQVTIMIFVYTLMVFAVMLGYAILSSRAREFMKSGWGMLILNRAGAAIFAVIGLVVLVNAAGTFFA